VGSSGGNYDWHVGPDRRKTKWIAILSAALALCLVVIAILVLRSCSAAQPTPAPTVTVTATASAAASTQPDPSRSPAPTGTPAVDTPAAESPATSGESPVPSLDELIVLPGEAPEVPDYDRTAFGQAWSDDVNVEFGHNGCDTRNDILRRDLVDITLKENTNGCVVLTGTLHDPYTGRTISFERGQDTSTLVQIDHVFPLAAAWNRGAAEWSAAERQDFANDPVNLLASDGAANQVKGAMLPDEWQPDPAWGRCRYAQQFVEVAAKYTLPITTSEKEALAEALTEC
jgi:hypothetical protein